MSRASLGGDSWHHRTLGTSSPLDDLSAPGAAQTDQREARFVHRGKGSTELVPSLLVCSLP